MWTTSDTYHRSIVQPQKSTKQVGYLRNGINSALPFDRNGYQNRQQPPALGLAELPGNRLYTDNRHALHGPGSKVPMRFADVSSHWKSFRNYSVVD